MTIADPSRGPIARAGPPDRQDRAARALAALLLAGVELARAGLQSVSRSDAEPDAVRDSRAALRRLRLLLRRFREWTPGADAGWDQALQGATRRLGAIRDLDLMARSLPRLQDQGAPWSPAFDAMLAEARDARAGLPEVPQAQPLVSTLRAIEAFARATAGAAGGRVLRPPRRVLAVVLDRLRRRVRRGAARALDCDDESLHRTRRRLRELRDLARIAAPRFERDAVRRYLRRVEAAHEALGAWHDALQFARRLDGEPDADAGAAWVRRSTAARIADLRDEGVRRLHLLARTPPFWS